MDLVNVVKSYNNVQCFIKEKFFFFFENVDLCLFCFLTNFLTYIERLELKLKYYGIALNGVFVNTFNHNKYI